MRGAVSLGVLPIRGIELLIDILNGNILISLIYRVHWLTHGNSRLVPANCASSGNPLPLLNDLLGGFFFVISELMSSGRMDKRTSEQRAVIVQKPYYLRRHFVCDCVKLKGSNFAALTRWCCSYSSPARVHWHEQLMRTSANAEQWRLLIRKKKRWTRMERCSRWTIALRGAVDNAIVHPLH